MTRADSALNLKMQSLIHLFRSLKNVAFGELWLASGQSNMQYELLGTIDGKELYLTLKERGILVRHFDSERLTQYNRITIGSKEQMEALIAEIKKILEEKK